MSNEKRTWYERTHQFTPYTKADGTAVSDEFDAIQASFERIPEMRDDGKGFAVSPLIPKPTDKNHPVTFGMLTESETSVNNARDDVTEKAQQVARNAQSVATNTQTAINKANSASQSASSALSSRQSAEQAENMARKWAANPVDQLVAEGKYSAYHYATKAAQSAHNLSVAEQSARENAQLATQKAEEVKQDVYDVSRKAEQVARNTTSVDENTRLAVDCANQAKQSAGSAQDNREKTENALALTQKYATQAATSAQNLSVAEQSAQNYANIAVEKANIAIQKALEAVQAAEQAASIAGGEVEYSKLLNVPRADTNTTGVTRLTNDTGLDSEQLGLTAKAGKSLSQAIANLRLSVNSLPRKSDSVNSNSSNTVASSAAVKAAYDKGVEAKNMAESAVSIVNEAKSSIEASGQALITAFQNQVNNNTKNIADKFNQSVSERVSKSGDTMTGTLTVPHIVVNDPSNNNNSVTIGDDAKFLDVDIGDTIGLQSTGTPARGYIAYGTNKKRFGYDGSNFISEAAIYSNSGFTSTANYSAFRIATQGYDLRMELENGRFKFWNNQPSTGQTYQNFLPRRNGELLVDSDMSYQKIGDFEIWKFSNGIMFQFYTHVGTNGRYEKYGKNEVIIKFNWAISFIDIFYYPKPSVNNIGGEISHYYNKEHQLKNFTVTMYAIGRWK